MIRASRFGASARQAAASVLAALALGCSAIPANDTVVTRVIDGDTVQMGDGRLIRYIGMDTPEIRRRIGDRWVEDPEPFGKAAADANRRLVDHQRVRLEYDVERRDRFGRWLAYVYVGETMVNEELVRSGFARPLTIPPNVRYAQRFRELAEEARTAGRGLWSLRETRRGVK